MSGYGGNLTYPSTKIFKNSVGRIADPGVDGQWIRKVNDLKLAPAGKTLFFEEYGEMIPNNGGAKVTRVDHKDATSRIVNLSLSQKAPCDECNAELGFTVVAEAKHPAVFNDNLFGQRRTYAHGFKRLEPIMGGYISDLDLQKAYADICQQITDDSGRYNGQMQGNVESVVDASVVLTFSADVSGGTFDVPAAGIYGETAANVADYIDATGGNVIKNTGGAVTNPGFGFIVHIPGTETLDSHYIALMTKAEYTNKTTFHLEKYDGVKTIVQPGNFELLPWEEVFREFSHMAHDVPLSNHHYVEKPSNVNAWSKFIIETTHSNAAIHGASHGHSYKQSVILFVSDADSDNIDDLETLLNSWSS